MNVPTNSTSNPLRTGAAVHDPLYIIGPSMTIGFFAATFLWTTWFITHLPWLGLAQQVALPIMLAVWFGAFVWGGTFVRARRVQIGALAGFVSAALGLLILFSMIGGAKASEGAEPGPNKLLMAGAFLVFGALVGLAGTLAGGVRARAEIFDSPQDWLARFAKVAVLATAPLLFVGGLVTSTQSGMAVPDWPTTFGMNMFLYPLGPRVDPGVYFEHSHRLFGTLVGAASVVLAFFGGVAGPTRFVQRLSVIAFVLVASQGVLGGMRVIQNKTALAMVHGISAQLIFACLVVLAVHLSRGYQAVSSTPVLGARRAKLFGTLAMHSLIVQLVLGAAYRHLRHDHILYTHALFAFLVTFGAFIAAATAWGLRDARTSEPLPASGLPARAATWVGISVIVQFVLGWFAFGFAGKQMQAADVGQALLRTVHQANGALLLGAVTALFVAARGAFRASRDVMPAR